MNVPAKLAAFALVLVATFGGGWALGATIGPDPTPTPTTPPSEPDGHGGQHSLVEGGS